MVVKTRIKVLPLLICVLLMAPAWACLAEDKTGEGKEESDKQIRLSDIIEHDKVLEEDTLPEFDGKHTVLVDNLSHRIYVDFEEEAINNKPSIEALKSSISIKAGTKRWKLKKEDLIFIVEGGDYMVRLAQMPKTEKLSVIFAPATLKTESTSPNKSEIVTDPINNIPAQPVEVNWDKAETGIVEVNMGEGADYWQYTLDAGETWTEVKDGSKSFLLPEGFHRKGYVVVEQYDGGGMSTRPALSPRDIRVSH